ncbi:hypothetical protein [Bacillus massiliigorillae]|uniref:hypothetical protein n=1 Tax=Bacillus massiliigorillae TaxID=1243664 RepID=UPI0003A24AA2|nr:hypothetical protein [Bacillus massiliigorillae]
MFKKRLLILVLLAISLIAALELLNSYKTHKEMKILQQESHQILTESNKNLPFSNLKTNMKNNTINIDLDIDTSFDNLQPISQFAYFEYFSKKLRFELLHNEYKNDLYKFDIMVTAHSNNKAFQYNNTLPNKQMIYKVTSYLSINQKVIYTSSEFKKDYDILLAQIPKEKVNGHDDIDIYLYGENFFNLLTKYGKYFNQKRDKDTIVNAVMEEFDITKEEYYRIYNKYYLFFAK